MNCCFFYPQITQISADFWDFFKGLSGFTLIEINVVKLKTISLICGNLRNLRIKKRRLFQTMRFIASRNDIHKNPLNPQKSLKSAFLTHTLFTNGRWLDTQT
jgi:hypothetical protein